MLQAVLTLAALLMVHHTTALQQLNDRQSRFVADLTHELKTPLTSLIGYATCCAAARWMRNGGARRRRPSTMSPHGWRA